MSGDGNELASSYHSIPQSYGGSLPAGSGFPEILQPGLPMPHPCIDNYTNHSAPALYVSSQLNSLADGHLNSYTTNPLQPIHQVLMHTNPHFMEQIHSNQPASLTQTTRQLHSVRQQLPGGPPLIKQEPGLNSGLPGGLPFIKQEPGLILGLGPQELIPGFIKQEPGLMGQASKEFSLEEPRYVHREFPFIEGRPEAFCRNGALVKQEQRVTCKQEAGLGEVQYKSVKQEVVGGGVEFGAAFPSQPLDFNFMADIEDIIQPSNCGE